VLLLYGVRESQLAGDPLGEVVELSTSREQAEETVAAWDRDEPEQVGLLDVVEVELEASAN